MKQAHSNQLLSVRKKLIAALAMLLVACIMTVSSTYAWFTLSTAPEVKGISTTVGANGNLEMALGTIDTFLGSSSPASYVGSSMSTAGQSVLDANITWGNLVDLSDASYGLGNIALYPSRLNANGSTISRTSPLQYPKYGADGRVIELSNNTLIGAYDSVSGGFSSNPQAPNAGVSGVGSVASMSPRAFAVMNNKSALTSNKNAAANAAKDAIRLYAGQLASIALTYQNDDGTGVVSEADITVLKNLIAKLNQSNEAISESMKSAVLVVLAAAPNIDDAAWAAGAGLANGKDIAEYITALGAATEVAGVSLPSAVTDLAAEYSAIKADLDAASAALPESGDSTWAAIEASVGALLNPSYIQIGGYTIAEVKADYAASGMGGNVVKDLFNKMNSNSLTFSFASGSGVFSDIADMTGNYTSSMTFPEGTEVEGLDLNMLGAKPVEVKGENGSAGALGALATVVADMEAPAADGNAVQTLTDTYGYVIDLLFRTNATESDLLLQTEAAGRVYNNGVEDTQGNGSNMTFTLTAEYDEAKVAGLANGIRVVFFDNAGNILGVATLDTNGATVTGGAAKMDLQLMNYEIAGNGQITLNGVKADNKLCSMTANHKVGVSALVYLDGDVIDNSHAGTFESLQATLNLQFSSSAELNPMENADLMGN